MTHGTDHSLVTRDLDELKTRLSATESKNHYLAFVIPEGQVFSCTIPSDEWLSEFILEVERGTHC